MTWPVGTAVQSELDALHAECAALRAERDEAVRLCEVHKEDAMREIAEANELAARADEAVALLREVREDAKYFRMPTDRIDAFLAKHKEQP